MTENKIKIISLSTTYPESPESTKPKFVHALNKELVKLGAEVKVVIPHSKNLPKKTKMDSVDIRSFHYLPEKYQINYESIPDLIKSTSGKIKVIIMIFRFFLATLSLCSKEKNYILHGHWAFPSGYLAYLISRIFKKKFIVTVHGSEIPLLEKFSFIKKLTVNSLNKSSMVIISNNFLKNKLLNIGINEEKITLIKPIPNFVNHENDIQLLNKFKLNITPLKNEIILFVGRLTEVKGAEFLIRAVPQITLKNIHLVIVGDGVLRDKLKELTKSLQLEDKVTFFGAANKNDLALLYDISDVLVLPSIVTENGETEGTGLVIPEAMESGLPVIATSVGGIVDTVKNEVNGLLVEQKNPKAIANAIERIFSDEDLKKKMIENSKQTVKEFSPTVIAQSYFNILQSLGKN